MKNMHSFQQMCFATFCDFGVNPITEKLLHSLVPKNMTGYLHFHAWNLT